MNGTVTLRKKHILESNCIGRKDKEHYHKKFAHSHISAILHCRDVETFPAKPKVTKCFNFTQSIKGSIKLGYILAFHK